MVLGFVQKRDLPLGSDVMFVKLSLGMKYLAAALLDSTI